MQKIIIRKCVQLIFICCQIYGCSNENAIDVSKVQSEKSIPSILPTSSGYKLSDKESSVLNNILRSSSYSGMAPDSMSSLSEVLTAFQENAIAAEIKYTNSPVLIEGTVFSVNKNSDKLPSVSLIDPVLGESVDIRFKNPDLQRLARLKRGHKLFVSCAIKSTLDGKPVFLSCRFFDEILFSVIENWLNGDKLPDNGIITATLMAILYGKSISDDNSVCLGLDEPDACLNEAHHHLLSNNQLFLENAGIVKSELVKAGIKFPADWDTPN